MGFGRGKLRPYIWIYNIGEKCGQAFGRHISCKTLSALVGGNRTIHGTFERHHPQYRRTRHRRQF